MPSGTPQISVLMSVYNDARFLPLALESLLSQTEPDFEIIIIDDCSTDGTVEILRQAQAQDPRIQVLRPEHQQGLTANLNRALSHAQGTLIARMDSDDLCTPQRFERQASFLNAHPKVGVVGCFFEKIDAAGQSLGNQTALPLDDAGIRRFLQSGNPLCHGGVMLRKKLLTDIYGYRDCFSAAQDYDLWLRIPPEAHFANIPEVLYSHRRHGLSVSYQKRLLQYQMKSLALQLYRERQQDAHGQDSLMRFTNPTAQQAFLTQWMRQDLQENRQTYSRLFLETGKRNLRSHQASEARQQFQRSIQLNPLQFKGYQYWLETYLG